jgi:hypothetical protein
LKLNYDFLIGINHRFQNRAVHYRMIGSAARSVGGSCFG